MNFNSIKVQLELAMPKPLNFCSCYFNSIKVQLEPGGSDIPDMSDT